MSAGRQNLRNFDSLSPFLAPGVRVSDELQFFARWWKIGRAATIHRGEKAGRNLKARIRLGRGKAPRPGPVATTAR